MGIDLRQLGQALAGYALGSMQGKALGQQRQVENLQRAVALKFQMDANRRAEEEAGRARDEAPFRLEALKTANALSKYQLDDVAELARPLGEIDPSVLDTQHPLHGFRTMTGSQLMMQADVIAKMREVIALKAVSPQQVAETAQTGAAAAITENKVAVAEGEDQLTDLAKGLPAQRRAIADKMNQSLLNIQLATEQPTIQSAIDRVDKAFYDQQTRPLVEDVKLSQAANRLRDQLITKTPREMGMTAYFPENQWDTPIGAATAGDERQLRFLSLKAAQREDQWSSPAAQQSYNGLLARVMRLGGPGKRMTDEQYTTLSDTVNEGVKKGYYSPQMADRARQAIESVYTLARGVGDPSLNIPQTQRDQQLLSLRMANDAAALAAKKAGDGTGEVTTYDWTESQVREYLIPVSEVLQANKSRQPGQSMRGNFSGIQLRGQADDSLSSLFGSAGKSRGALGGTGKGYTMQDMVDGIIVATNKPGTGRTMTDIGTVALQLALNFADLKALDPLDFRAYVQAQTEQLARDYGFTIPEKSWTSTRSKNTVMYGARPSKDGPKVYTRDELEALRLQSEMRRQRKGQ